MTVFLPTTLTIISIFTMTLIPLSTQLFFGSTAGGGCGGYSAPSSSCGCSPQPACSPCGGRSSPYYRQAPPAPYIAPQQSYIAPQAAYVPAQPQQAYVSQPHDYQTAPKPQVYIKPTSRVAPEIGYTDRNTPLIIEKSLKGLTSDTDQDALATFESTLETYKMQNRGGLRRREATKKVDIEDGEKCSSKMLKKIIVEAMSESVSISKLRISQKAKKAFGYNFDVICSEHDFSYLISSNIHCRVQRFGLICLAYEN